MKAGGKSCGEVPTRASRKSQNNSPKTPIMAMDEMMIRPAISLPFSQGESQRFTPDFAGVFGLSAVNVAIVVVVSGQ